MRRSFRSTRRLVAVGVVAGLAVLALAALPIINLVAKKFATNIHPVSLGLQQQLAGVATVALLGWLTLQTIQRLHAARA